MGIMSELCSTGALIAEGLALFLTQASGNYDGHDTLSYGKSEGSPPPVGDWHIAGLSVISSRMRIALRLGRWSC